MSERRANPEKVERLGLLLRDLFMREEADAIDALTAMGAMAEHVISAAWSDPKHRRIVSERFVSVLRKAIARRGVN